MFWFLLTCWVCCTAAEGILWSIVSVSSSCLASGVPQGSPILVLCYTYCLLTIFQVYCNDDNNRKRVKSSSLLIVVYFIMVSVCDLFGVIVTGSHWNQISVRLWFSVGNLIYFFIHTLLTICSWNVWQYYFWWKKYDFGIYFRHCLQSKKVLWTCFQ